MSLPSIEAALRNAAERLTTSGSDSAKIDAAVLLCHALAKPRSYLLTWPEKALTQEQFFAFENLLEQRVSGKPVAYIVGEREFWSLALKVSPYTLIPRPDTERLVEVALQYLENNAGKVLDLGSGTGAIALAIASERTDLQVIGVDLQPEAAALGKENAEKHSIKNAEFRCGSWFDPVKPDEKFSLIVSNPPYIDEQDPHLSQGDVRFEPASALVAAEQGLADIRHIASEALAFLAANGWIAFEHGYAQGAAVRQLLLDLGYRHVATEQDYAGQDRVTSGQYLAE